jgi:hypothetical protein
VAKDQNLILYITYGKWNIETYMKKFNKLLLDFMYEQHMGVASSVSLVPIVGFYRPLSCPRVLPFIVPLALPYRGEVMIPPP